MENQEIQSSLLRIVFELNLISRKLDLPLEVVVQANKKFKDAIDKSLEEDRIIPKVKNKDD